MPRQGAAFDLRNPLDRFLAGKSRHEYAAGESIYSQGDPADAVFYIQSGKVNLTVVSMNGKEAVVAHLPEGSFFGEASLAGEQHRTASASALQAGAIIRIDDVAMLDLLRHEPEFAAHFRETGVPADLPPRHAPVEEALPRGREVGVADEGEV